MNCLACMRHASETLAKCYDPEYDGPLKDLQAYLHVDAEWRRRWHGMTARPRMKISVGLGFNIRIEGSDYTDIGWYPYDSYTNLCHFMINAGEPAKTAFFDTMFRTSGVAFVKYRPKSEVSVSCELETADRLEPVFRMLDFNSVKKMSTHVFDNMDGRPLPMPFDVEECPFFLEHLLHDVNSVGMSILPAKKRSRIPTNR